MLTVTSQIYVVQLVMCGIYFLQNSDLRTDGGDFKRLLQIFERRKKVNIFCS